MRLDIEGETRLSPEQRKWNSQWTRLSIDVRWSGDERVQSLGQEPIHVVAVNSAPVTDTGLSKLAIDQAS